MSVPNFRLLFALNDAISEVLNAHGATRNCPPLSWSAASLPGLHGQASIHRGSSETPGEIAGRWAAEFGLHAEKHPVAGTVSYQGRIEWVPVTVWAITDGAAFDRAGRDSGPDSEQ